MSTINKNKTFLFPQANSTVLPDPSNFFSSNLLSTPLPTNSFFQNFSLKNGDQPEYIHPYLIKSSNSSISVSYPTRSSSSAVISQVFNNDLTITSNNKQSSDGKHIISSYSDLGVTLDIPFSSLSVFLVRGSPYLTFSVFDIDLFRVLRAELGEDFNSFTSKKVVAIAGDVAIENFGIKDEKIKNEIFEEIDVLVHSAASTKLDER
ncbi:hypothetical protein RYX36_026318 [Vicia faba]